MNKEKIRYIIKDLNTGIRMIIFSTILMYLMAFINIFYVSTLPCIIMGSIQLITSTCIGAYAYNELRKLILKQKDKLKELGDNK